MCEVCNCTFLPLTYTVPLDDYAGDVDDRPKLKCVGCGQQYRWQDSAGWAAFQSLQR